MVAFLIQPVGGTCSLNPCDDGGPCSSCYCNPNQDVVNAEQTIGAGSPVDLGLFDWTIYPDCHYLAQGSPPFTDFKIFYDEATTKWTITYESGGGGGVIYRVLDGHEGCGSGPANFYYDEMTPANYIEVTDYP